VLFNEEDLVEMALIAAKRLAAIVGVEFSKPEEESIRKRLKKYLQQDPEAGGWRLTIVALDELGRLRDGK